MSACDCCDWVRPSARCGCDRQGGEWGAPRGVLLRYETEQARSEGQGGPPAFRSASGEREMRACETRAETRGEARPSGPHSLRPWVRIVKGGHRRAATRDAYEVYSRVFRLCTHTC